MTITASYKPDSSDSYAVVIRNDEAGSGSAPNETWVRALTLGQAVRIQAIVESAYQLGYREGRMASMRTE